MEIINICQMNRYLKLNTSDNLDFKYNEIDLLNGNNNRMSE
jgi:hypothetical protein